MKWCRPPLLSLTTLAISVIVMSAAPLPASILGLIDITPENPWTSVSAEMQGLDMWSFTDGRPSPLLNTAEVQLWYFLRDQTTGDANPEAMALSFHEDRNMRSWLIILLSLTIGFLVKVKPAIQGIIEKELGRIFGPLDEY